MLTSEDISLANNAAKAAASQAIDLLFDAPRVVTREGLSTKTAFYFNVERGITEDSVEESVGSAFTSPASGVALSAGQILVAARQSNIALAILGGGDTARLSTFGLSLDASARITQSLQQGDFILVPSAQVMIDGQHVMGWFQIDPNSGQTVGVVEDGSHGEFAELVARYAVTAVGIGLFLGMIKGQLLVDEHKIYGKSVEDVKKEKDEVLTVSLVIGSPSTIISVLTENPFPLPPVRLATTFLGVLFDSFAFAVFAITWLERIDPPMAPSVFDLHIPLPTRGNVVAASAFLRPLLSGGSASGASSRLWKLRLD